MNNAKKEMIIRQKRNEAIAYFICWLLLAGATLLIGKLLLSSLRIFFSLWCIH